jgi:hypothetical protein
MVQCSSKHSAGPMQRCGNEVRCRERCRAARGSSAERRGAEMQCGASRCGARRCAAVAVPARCGCAVQSSASRRGVEVQCGFVRSRAEVQHFGGCGATHRFAEVSDAVRSDAVQCG